MYLRKFKKNSIFTKIEIMEETWKDIKDYEGMYQVSNLGRVKSLKKNIILKMNKCSSGYYNVSFWKNGKEKKKLIHRLVAEAFLDNPDNLPVINHKDENKTNNSVENLEWCTYYYNFHYGSGKEKMSIANSKPVYQYTISGELVKKWDSATDVYKELGWLNTTISKCCRGKQATSHGYIWQYA